MMEPNTYPPPSGEPLPDDLSGPHTAPLVSDYLDDPEYMELVHVYIGDLPHICAEIRAAFDQGNWSNAYTLSHHLKGSGGMYGFRDLTKLGADLEQSAREHNVPRAYEHLATFLSLIARIQLGLAPPSHPS